MREVAPSDPTPWHSATRANGVDSPPLLRQCSARPFRCKPWPASRRLTVSPCTMSGKRCCRPGWRHSTFPTSRSDHQHVAHGTRRHQSRTSPGITLRCYCAGPGCPVLVATMRGAACVHPPGLRSSPRVRWWLMGVASGMPCRLLCKPLSRLLSPRSSSKTSGGVSKRSTVLPTAMVAD